MADQLPQGLLSGSEASRVRLRPARGGEGRFFPPVERSAGELFRRIEGLGWIADADDLPEQFHERLISAGTCWVANSGPDGIVGFLSAETVPGALHIWEFSVAAGWQNHGIGRRLIEYAINEACQRGSGSVTLTTFRDVPWNAPFYARLGFRQVCGSDEWLDNILREDEAAGFKPGTRCAMRLDLARQ
jgi:GNAT superfamily N-acetyltransferase